MRELKQRAYQVAIIGDSERHQDTCVRPSPAESAKGVWGLILVTVIRKFQPDVTVEANLEVIITRADAGHINVLTIEAGPICVSTAAITIGGVWVVTFVQSLVTTAMTAAVEEAKR